jgi:hypothetical protein
MLSYYDMPLADDEIDYAAQDEQIRQTRQWLRDELPWVSTAEMEELTRQDDFPGFLADYDRLATFVGKFKRGKARYVACKVQQRSFTVGARVDLVSGLVYLSDNGRSVLSNVDGSLFVEVPVPASPYRNPRRTDATTRKFGGDVRNGRMALLSGAEMHGMVDALARARMLAPL